MDVHSEDWYRLLKQILIWVSVVLGIPQFSIYISNMCLLALLISGKLFSLAASTSREGFRRYNFSLTIKSGSENTVRTTGHIPIDH